MPISFSSSRNDLVERSLSRISVSLCWTSGCSTTVTPSMGFPDASASENRAVADDLEGRRAVGPARACDLAAGRPRSALQDLGQGEGGSLPAQPSPHHLGEPV